MLVYAENSTYITFRSFVKF